MTKIAERIFEEDGKIVVQETHDFNSAIETAKVLRSHGMDRFGESNLVGVVPFKIWCEWAKEAGVRFDDKEGMKEVLKRKLLDPDFSHFRVWGGKY